MNISPVANAPTRKSVPVQAKARPETMGDRILALIAAYNRRRPATERELRPQRLSLLASEGKNPDVIRDLLKRERAGDYNAGIDAERLFRIARFFGVTPAYLRTGVDDMDALNVTASPFPVQSAGVGQPVISVISPAGGPPSEEAAETLNGIRYAAEAIKGEMFMPLFVLNSLSHHARPGGVHWIEMRGDHMEPTICSGDWVAVNVDDRNIETDGIFALRNSRGGALIRRVEPGEKPGHVDLISDNPRHRRRTETTGELEVIGRVFGRITRMV